MCLSTTTTSATTTTSSWGHKYSATTQHTFFILQLVFYVKTSRKATRLPFKYWISSIFISPIYSEDPTNRHSHRSTFQIVMKPFYNMTSYARFVYAIEYRKICIFHFMKSGSWVARLILFTCAFLPTSKLSAKQSCVLLSISTLQQSIWHSSP